MPIGGFGHWAAPLTCTSKHSSNCSAAMPSVGKGCREQSCAVWLESEKSQEVFEDLSRKHKLCCCHLYLNVGERGLAGIAVMVMLQRWRINRQFKAVRDFLPMLLMYRISLIEWIKRKKKKWDYFCCSWVFKLMLLKFCIIISLCTVMEDFAREL